MMMGFADFPVAALKAIKVHPDSVKKPQSQPEGASVEPTERQSRSPAHSGTSTPTESVRPGGTGRPASTFNLNDSLSKISGHAPGSPTSGPSSPRLETRTNSMANALRDQLGDRLRSRSRSKSGSRSRASSSAGREGGRDAMTTLDDVLNTGKGVSKIVTAGFKSPMDFTHGLAKGFHNAPKLYGDNVRKSEPITDFRTGIKAASREFGYGFYDGITGLVTQPIDGAKKEGAAGFVKGFGKGIGGIVFKPGAAIFGLPAYTMKGVYKELQQRMGSSVQNYIIAARTAQGYDEWRSSSQDEREDIIRRWYVVNRDLKKKRNPHEQLQDLIAEQRQKARQRGDGGNKIQSENDGKTSRSNAADNTSKSRANSGNNLLARLREGLDFQRDRQGAGNTSRSLTEPSPLVSPPTAMTGSSGNSNLQHARTEPAHGAGSAELERRQLEESIHASVVDSSRGNAEEDAMIERAIKASINELTTQPPDYTETAEDEEEHYRRALDASIAEAEEYARAHPGGDGADDVELAKALKASLEASQAKREERQKTSDSEWDSSTDDEQIHEKDLQRAISASKEQAPELASGAVGGTGAAEPPPYEDEQELNKAMSASREAEDERTKQDEEERIVMEYVKKQSLREEEHRKELLHKGKGKEAEQIRGGDEADDEELQRAIKMSMSRDGEQGESSK